MWLCYQFIFTVQQDDGALTNTNTPPPPRTYIYHHRTLNAVLPGGLCPKPGFALILRRQGFGRNSQA